MSLFSGCGLLFSALVICPFSRTWPDWAKANYEKNAGKPGLQLARGPMPLFYLPRPVLEKAQPLIAELRTQGVIAQVSLFRPPPAQCYALLHCTVM